MSAASRVALDVGALLHGETTLLLDPLFLRLFLIVLECLHCWTANILPQRGTVAIRTFFNGGGHALEWSPHGVDE
ncbi:MAG: hypothetical protein WAK20_00890 [Candidatus Acidiferrum sp.]